MYENSDGWGCGGMYAGAHACTCMHNTEAPTCTGTSTYIVI